MEQKTTLPADLQRSQEIASRYGSVENAIIKLHPNTIQNALYKYSIKSNKQAYLTDSITLSTFCKAYSRNSVLGLIEIWLFELSEFVGVNGKLNESQIKQLANMVYSDAYALNFAEFGLFFSRVKSGYYGEFFGNVDPIKIMTFLGQFLIERSQSVEEYNKELDQDKKRQDFQNCLNMQLTDEQKKDIENIMNNFIKQMKR